MLPWLQEKMRREPSAVEYTQDCSACMKKYGADVRRELGCGFEHDRKGRSFVWNHEGNPGEPPTMCPGYTTKLPMVREVAASYIHWEKGTLEQRFRGHELPEPLLDALEILHGNVSEVQSWDLKRRADK